MRELSKNIVFLLIICFYPLSISLAQSNTNTLPDTTTNTEETSNSNVGFLEDYYTGIDVEPTQNTPEESIAITLLRIFLITGILAFLTWMVLRFFFRRNSLALSTNGKSIEVLATVPAGLGSYFLIAKLSNLYYLFSLSTDGLRLLDKISDQEAIDFIELNKAQTLPQDIKFVDLLEHLPEGKPKQALEFLRNKITDLKKK